MDNLPELRDIHLPDGVSVFPLAYGWWILLSILVLLPIIIKFVLSLRRKSKKLYALLILKKIAQRRDIASAISISELLRRICVYKYPQAINLFSAEWLNFLQAKCSQKISQSAAKLLTDAPYINKDSSAYSSEDYLDLYKFARAWIGENL